MDDLPVSKHLLYSLILAAGWSWTRELRDAGYWNAEKAKNAGCSDKCGIVSKPLSTSGELGARHLNLNNPIIAELLARKVRERRCSTENDHQEQNTNLTL